MKKILLFFVALFACASSAWAQKPTASTAPSNGRWATDTKWYFIQFPNSDAYHSAGYLSTEGDSYINSDGQLLLNGTTKPTTTAGLWCFVGDDTDGYTVYNRKSGVSLVLSMTTGGVAKMLASGSDGYNQAFDYTETTSTTWSGKATFKLHGTDNCYWNNSDGSPKCHLGIWANNNALADNGSAVAITEVTTDELVAMGVAPKVSTNDDINWFYIKNKRSGKYAAHAGDSNQMVQQASLDRTTASLWYVTAVDGGGYLLHNKATENLYASNNSFTSEGATTYFVENAFNPGYFCVSLNADYSNTGGDKSWDDSNTTKVGFWTPSASDKEGTSWSIEYSTGDVDKDLLGALLEVAKKTIGTDPGFYPQEEVDKAQAVYNGTDTSKSYTEARNSLEQSFILPKTGTYYQIVNAYPEFENKQSVKKAIYADAENNAFKWNTIDVSNTAFFWSITPDGDGYKISPYSSNTTFMSGVGTLAETAATITLVSLGEGQFNIKCGDNTFHANGHSSGSGESGTIVSWGGSLNSASSWYIQEVSDPALTSAKASLSAKIDEFDNKYLIGINPGQYSFTNITAADLASAINTAKGVLDSDSKQANDYQKALEAFNNAVSNAEKVKNTMNVGGYYRIQSTTRNTYTGIQDDNKKTGTSKMWNYDGDDNDPRQIWKLVEEVASSGTGTSTSTKYFLVNVASGLYPQYVKGGSTNTTDMGEKSSDYAFTWAINTEATESAYPTHNIKFGGRQVNIESAGYVNMWWGDNAHHYLWTVEKTDDEILTLVKDWAETQEYAKNANAPKIDIDANATVIISPSEYAEPKVVNAAIDAVKAYADTDTPTLAQAQALYNAHNIVDTYKSNTDTYGAALSVAYKQSAEYGTLILPINFSCPEGWTRYYCSEVNNGTLVLSDFEDQDENEKNASKNKPFIVYAPEKAGTTYQFIGYSGGASTKNVTKGLLTGVLAEETTYVPDGSYILAKKNDKIGFYQVEGDNVKVAARYKCYLTVPATQANSVKAIYFPGEGTVTSIDEIFGGEENNGTVYDLQGRRVNNAAHGIYIINGKKVLK